MEPVALLAASNLASKVLPGIFSPSTSSQASSASASPEVSSAPFSNVLKVAKAQGLNHISATITAEHIRNQLNALPEMQALLNQPGLQGASWKLDGAGQLQAILPGNKQYDLPLSQQSAEIVRNLFAHAQQQLPPANPHLISTAESLQLDLLGAGQRPTLTWFMG